MVVQLVSMRDRVVEHLVLLAKHWQDACRAGQLLQLIEHCEHYLRISRFVGCMCVWEGGCSKAGLMVASTVPAVLCSCHG
jgi:hypothetical protein